MERPTYGSIRSIAFPLPSKGSWSHGVAQVRVSSQAPLTGPKITLRLVAIFALGDKFSVLPSPYLSFSVDWPLIRVRTGPTYARAWGVLFALGVSVGWGMACSSAPSEKEGAAYFGRVVPRHGPHELWINNGTEPEWIDPGRCTDSAGGTIVLNLFAGLTQPHPQTLEPIPDVAESWTVSEDGRSYVFRLRPTQWSDGRPLTARDFEWSWKRVLDPATASRYASFLYVLARGEAFARRALMIRPQPSADSSPDLRGFVPAGWEATLRTELASLPVEKVEFDSAHHRAFVFFASGPQAETSRAKTLAHFSRPGSGWQAEITDSSVVGVKALDDVTLRVSLTHPVPYFLSIAMFYTALPVPRHVLDRLQKQGMNPDLWTRPEHIVTNGPYTLKEWKFRQYMLVEKNPRYWDAEHVRLERVRLHTVDSATTTLNLYEAGEFDYVGTNASLPSEFMDRLSQYDDFHRYPYLGVYFYWFNTQAPPMDNVHLRRALSLAIDRRALVDHILRSGQVPTADLVPQDLAGYQALASPIFDPSAAKQALKQAGYQDGSEVPPVTLIYNTSEGHKKVAEAIQAMWKETLGVHVDIENQEWKVYLKNLQAMNFQISRMGWIGDYADPFTFLELLLSHNGNNHSSWANSRYDSMLAQANQSSDPTHRLATLRRAEALAMGEAPVMPVYVYTRSEMWKPYLMGHWPNYQNRHPFKYWWIDERWYDGVPDRPLPNDPPPLPSLTAPTPDSSSEDGP